MSWTWRREFAHIAGFAAALLAALLLAGFDRAWWLRSLVADALAPFGWACAGIAVLLVAAREYPSAGLAAGVTVLSWLGWFLLRPPEGGAW